MSVVRILIVDDAQAWRRFVSAVLRQEPSFEIVGEAPDGLAGVKGAQQMRPTVVLLDIGLPGLNGMEAADGIRKLAADTKIVFVSQERDPDIVRAAMGLGAWGYVLKSDAARDLVAAIHSVVQGKKFISRGLADYGLDGA